MASVYFLSPLQIQLPTAAGNKDIKNVDFTAVKSCPIAGQRRSDTPWENNLAYLSCSLTTHTSTSPTGKHK